MWATTLKLGQLTASHHTPGKSHLKTIKENKMSVKVKKTEKMQLFYLISFKKKKELTSYEICGRLVV